MRRISRWVAAAALLGLGAWAYRVYASRLRPYARFAKAYWAGRRFYATYPHVAQDVAFHPNVQPLLDVYSRPAGDGHPVLVFVHGGSWKDHDRKLFAPVAAKLLPHGLVVVIPDHTLNPHAGYEQMAREIAAALSWTLDHSQEYGGDPKRVFLSGHSSGAHLALLAVMDPRFLAEHGKSAAQVCGLIGLSGVYDVQAEHDFWQAKGVAPEIITQVMGGTAHYRAASPLSYVRAGLPPALLIHGDHDQTVPVAQSTAMHAALCAAGVQSELVVYAGASHTDFLFDALTVDRRGLVATIARFASKI